MAPSPWTAITYMNNSNMPANERDIQAYIDILRPASLSDLGDFESDRTCPICQDPYPEFDYDGSQDYPVSPWLRRPGLTCEHIFGRICIEEHIRSGQSYSMRCPICREQWFGSWQASPEDEFELDDDPLSRAIAWGVRERQGRLEHIVEAHEPGEFYREGDPESDLQSFTVPRETAPPQHGVSVVGRVYRSIGLLERMQSIYHLQSVDAEELEAVREFENAVERLWLKLDERNQYS
jgi:hypothetical protein